MKIPSVTREEMIEIDRAMTDDFGIDLLIMMENAGRNLAIQAKRMFGGSVIGQRIVVLAGKGNNGGGGLVAGRHLHNWGAIIYIISTAPEEIKNIPKKQFEINRAIGTENGQDINLKGFDLIIDSLIGYNLRGNPREPIDSLIRRTNNSGIPILSLDLPSGLDANSGHAYNPCIKATITLTLALPKTGLIEPTSREFVGKLFLADISIPRKIYNKFGIDDGILFTGDSITPIVTPN